MDSTTIVSLGALAVAALSLWLTYRERAAGLRGALYAKQVEAYGRVLEALAERHAVAIDFMRGKDFPLDRESRVELLDTAQLEIARFARVFTETVIFLPENVANAIGEYKKTFNAITIPPGRRSLFEDVADPQMELTTVFERVWRVMRHQLGTEALSVQTVKAVGAPPLSPEEQS
jgi:hypothetical protein